MGKVAVLVVHGMGDQKADFADEMITKLHHELGVARADIVFRTAWWAPILEPQETQLIRTLSRDNDLNYKRLRKFVIHAMGDAVAYQEVPAGQHRTNVYEQIHAFLGEELHQLRMAARDGLPADHPEPPLVIVAHSLGCHMISNHVWDLQNGRRDPVADNPFERIKTLAGIVTFGCNIPLFSLAYNKFIPIAFPGTGIREVLKSGTTEQQISEAARWLNFYDPDDVLAYPLKPLSNQYAKAVTADIAVNVGGILSSWNPASHMEYWTDRAVVKATAQLIAGIHALAF